jgi:hypothetical protein
MNSERNNLYKLHMKYIECAAKSIDSFIKDENSVVRNETEFCKEEKQNYFDYMRTHFKTEFENLIRLEGNNY